MNAFELNFIIIPLGTIVAILVGLVIYYANREDMATRRTKNSCMPSSKKGQNGSRL